MTDQFADTHFDAKNDYLPAKTVRGEIVNVTSPNFISAIEQEAKPGKPPKG